ncbi:hypothetical protein [Dehalococcoides sp. THU4]|uniref:hypothetical protein n=1 Tax=Dehalococcoides sp. THU4 TaxID=3348344 RepID=UPI0037139C1A
MELLKCNKCGVTINKYQPICDIDKLRAWKTIKGLDITYIDELHICPACFKELQPLVRNWLNANKEGKVGKNK